MLRSRLVHTLAAVAALVGCSTDECAEKDQFGRERKLSAEQQAECKKDDETIITQETSSGGGGATSTGSDSSDSNNTSSSGGGGSAGTSGGGSAPDTTPPSVTTFVRSASQLAMTNSFPVTFTVTFSEVIDPVTFTSADIVNVGTATAIAWSIAGTGDQRTFTISGTGSTSGTIQPKILNGAYADPAGNMNTSAHTSTDSVGYASGAVLVTVNQNSGQADPTQFMPILFRVQFTRPLNPATFTAGDIVQQGTASGVVWQLSTSDNVTWMLSATSSQTFGTIRPFIPNNVVQDVFGNGNTSSTSSDNSVTFQ